MTVQPSSLAPTPPAAADTPPAVVQLAHVHAGSNAVTPVPATIAAIDAAIEQLTLARAILVQQPDDEELELVAGKDYFSEDDRYFLKIAGTEVEVSKAEYDRVAGRAGVSFGSSRSGSFASHATGISGRISYGRVRW